VIIYVNGNKVVDYYASGEESKTITIPGEYVEDGRLFLTFELPDASSPKSLGVGEDDREVSLAFKSIAICPTK